MIGRRTSSWLSRCATSTSSSRPLPRNPFALTIVCLQAIYPDAVSWKLLPDGAGVELKVVLPVHFDGAKEVEVWDWVDAMPAAPPVTDDELQRKLGNLDVAESTGSTTKQEPGPGRNKRRRGGRGGAAGSNAATPAARVPPAARTLAPDAQPFQPRLSATSEGVDRSAPARQRPQPRSSPPASTKTAVPLPPISSTGTPRIRFAPPPRPTPEPAQAASPAPVHPRAAQKPQARRLAIEFLPTLHLSLRLPRDYPETAGPLDIRLSEDTGWLDGERRTKAESALGESEFSVLALSILHRYSGLTPLLPQLMAERSASSDSLISFRRPRPTLPRRSPSLSHLLFDKNALEPLCPRFWPRSIPHLPLPPSPPRLTSARSAFRHGAATPASAFRPVAASSASHASPTTSPSSSPRASSAPSHARARRASRSAQSGRRRSGRARSLSARVSGRADSNETRSSGSSARRSASAGNGSRRRSASSRIRRSRSARATRVRRRCPSCLRRTTSFGCARPAYVLTSILPETRCSRIRAPAGLLILRLLSPRLPRQSQRLRTPAILGNRVSLPRRRRRAEAHARATLRREQHQAPRRGLRGGARTARVARRERDRVSWVQLLCQQEQWVQPHDLLEV